MVEKVINVNFGKRCREENIPDRSAEEMPPDHVFREDHVSIRFLNFDLGAMGQQDFSPGAKLMRLQASPTALGTAKKIVQSWSTEDLVTKLEQSTEQDWKTKPSFYQAIFLECKRRLCKQ